MRRLTWVFAAILLVAVAGGARAFADGPSLSTGQTLYVPVYSHILHGNQNRSGKPEERLMSALLSIRSTDPVNALTVKSIRYYDTKGKLVREYPKVETLGPLETSEVFIEYQDRDGGSGANFIVEWEAPKPVNPPLVEVVHSYFLGTQSVVFISPSRAIVPTAK